MSVIYPKAHVSLSLCLDLACVKSHCGLWLAHLSKCSPSENSTEVIHICSEMERFVVEGNLLEIFCVEAKALALLLQELQSVTSEKENTMESATTNAVCPKLEKSAKSFKENGKDGNQETSAVRLLPLSPKINYRMDTSIS